RDRLGQSGGPRGHGAGRRAAGRDPPAAGRARHVAPPPSPPAAGPPLAPPGRPARPLASVIAPAPSGPLRHGFGPVRDQILGCTVVTGDGRIVKPGARVVKNVAGYDLTKLHVGGFGAFGIVTEAHLRLRALPRADVTLVSRGSRDALSAAARDLLEVGITPMALELA